MPCYDPATIGAPFAHHAGALPADSEADMAKQVFSRAQYLDILNDSLRKHPGWQPGMAFVFLPPGADASQATAVGCTGPLDAIAVYSEIQRVAAELIEVRE
jgi:hypothetical protein